jgi:hypothetical protein
MKLLLAILFTVLSKLQVLAQTQALPDIRLKKSEKMWFTAYDDTTKAIALLFIQKRNRFAHHQQKWYIAFGVSGVAMVAGGLIMESDLNSSPNASYEPTNYGGLILMLTGATTMLVSGVALTGSWIALNPYTLKKFNRLLQLYKEGKPLPNFYAKRIQFFLNQ